LLQNSAALKNFTVESIRERGADASLKINAEFIGTFKGTEDERKIKVDENTGKIKTFT
jgi:hypothetical protein